METKLNIQNQKLELIQWVSTLEDSSIIEKINELRKSENTKLWDSLSENEKQAIDSGILDADEGKINTHTKARQLYEKYL